MANFTNAQLRVLVVDDNADAADTLVLLLSAMDVFAQAVYSGNDAVEAAEEFAPSVVFLDLDMPRMSGYDVARVLRQRVSMQSATIVALTGRSDPATKLNVVMAGFNLHLPKPAGVEQILDVLHGVTGQSAGAY